MKVRDHGRAKYVAEKCRCAVCVQANRDYATRNERQRAYGRSRLVDAEPARRHVRTLMAAGVGRRRISELAGVSGSAVSKLVWGVPSKGRAPTRRLDRATADKILAVRGDPPALAGSALVRACGTQRRLRALVAVGWSQTRLAAELGVTVANFGGILKHQDMVLARRDRQVRKLYDRLWDQQPPAGSPRQRSAVARSRRYAAARGWAPPMAWDDDTIDDPAAEPDRGAPVGHGNRRINLDDVEFFEGVLGMSRGQVAQQLGVRVDSIDTAMRRAQRREVAA